jgi:ribosomal protein S18 acetylase RimI-like enzyme
MASIRPVTPDDLPFLRDMGWEAAAVAPEMRAMGRDAALAIPSIRKYLDGWGRLGDAGVIAIDEGGARLGAAWYRLFPADDPAYGFVAADIPELSIGVASDARGQGVGRALLDALLATARQQGYRAVSLSVDRQNPALRLYERAGFYDAGVSDPRDSSVTMAAPLS